MLLSPMGYSDLVGTSRVKHTNMTCRSPDGFWSDDEDSLPSVEGLNMDEKDDVLVIGIDFGTT